MRRILFGFTVLVALGVGACSLLNAPDEVRPGDSTSSSGGSGGAPTTSSSTTTTSTGGMGGGGGAGGGVGCTKAADCASLADACNIGACINMVCVKQPDATKNGKSCDDGLFCTENEICQSGQCMTTPTACPPAMDPCHKPGCDEVNHCQIVVGNDGDPCDDGDPCTSNDSCSAGACNPGKLTDCSMFTTECSVGQCMAPMGCFAAASNEGMPCDLSNPCSNSVCQGGTCQNNPKAGIEGLACDDGKACTFNESCKSGFCVAAVLSPCPPNDACGTWTCNEVTLACTVTATNEGLSCSDASICTSNTTCTAGVCGGGTGPQVYFKEDFHDNSQGWILGPEWQIGPTKQSILGTSGFFADPGIDHTVFGLMGPSLDNGIAGVIIGGNASTNIHPMEYLESPAFNTSVAAGQVILGFYRWLNSDYPPFMHNNIEVFNSTTNMWTVIYTSTQGTPLNDSQWSYFQYDLTGFKSPGTKLRFGVDVTQVNAFTIGSWNVDDIVVANNSCP